MSQPVWPPTLLALLKQLTPPPAPTALVPRCRAFFDIVAPDRATLPIIKVAGTNGKGSTCAMLEACLNNKQGIGLFTSPHLVTPRERIRIDGAMVTFDEMEDAARRVADLLTACGAVKPSFFEALIAIALDLFRRRNVRLAVFEAGVGGYNDAVHVLPGDLAALTTVGFDHVDRLGPTLADIARDKAGIVPDGGTLVLGPGLSADDHAVVRAESEPRGVTVIAADALPIDLNDRLPLAGHHQHDNARTALTLARLAAARFDLPFSPSAVRNAHWPARLEQRRLGRRTFLLDVAHNAQGLDVLSDYLDQTTPFDKRFLIYGAAEDKDYRACLATIPRLAPRGILVGGFYRAAPAELLTKRVGNESFMACNTPDHIGTMLPRDEDTTMIVCGSVFLVGTVVSLLDAWQAEPPTQPIPHS